MGGWQPYSQCIAERRSFLLRPVHAIEKVGLVLIETISREFKTFGIIIPGSTSSIDLSSKVTSWSAEECRCCLG